MATTRTTPKASANPMSMNGKSQLNGARPLLHQESREIQRYGSIVKLPIGLDEAACASGCKDLNQLLADTITLRDLYKKHHWQVVGHTFYQLHLLFDKHYEEQNALVDAIAERIQLLGGISLAMAPDIAEETRIERPPRGRKSAPVQISRLLEAHELILKYAREAAKRADENEDDGTNDLVVSDIVRLNELQVWFLAEHLVDQPVVRADESEKREAAWASTWTTGRGTSPRPSATAGTSPWPTASRDRPSALHPLRGALSPVSPTGEGLRGGARSVSVSGLMPLNSSAVRGVLAEPARETAPALLRL